MASHKDEAKWDVPEDAVYADLLARSDLWRGPLVQRAIQALQLPVGSRGLDAGCGIGQHTIRLAESVGPDGHVTGVDLSPSFVSCAEGMAEDAGLAPRATFCVADLNHLPFEDNAFDWLWSADTVVFGPSDQGYVAETPYVLLGELARVVRPGGRLAFAYCAAQNLLPGYPLLEAQLCKAAYEAEPFVRNGQPELHHLRALGWLREAGLTSVSSHTVAHDIRAPLEPDLRQALVGLLTYRWGSSPLRTLSDEGVAQYRRICEETSPEFILGQADFSTFFTCTVYSGTVGG